MAAMTEKSTMSGREARTIAALDLIGTPEAKALIDLLNAAVVAVNHADAQAEHANTAKPAAEALKAAEVNLEAVLTVIPFIVQIYDPTHYPVIRWPKDLVGTTPEYQYEQLRPALEKGGKISVFMGDVLDQAHGKRDKAAAHSKSAVVHDDKVRDRQVVERKGLLALLSKAEGFIRDNTSPSDKARQLIKRPRPVDTRTPEQKAADDIARIQKRLARAKEIEAKKAKDAADREARKAAKAQGQGASTTPTSPAPQGTVVTLPVTPTPPSPVVAANTSPAMEVVNG